MVSAINAAVVRSQDRRSLLQEVCLLAYRLGGYAVAVGALIDWTTRTARSVASGGVLVQGPPGKVFTIADSEAGDTSVTGRVSRTGEAVFCADLAATTLPV